MVIGGIGEKKMTQCPECLTDDFKIPPDSMQGEIISCADCGESFEIITLEPLKIVKAETEGEDWGQ